MDNFIWHNPRCSKSRQTLELLEHAGLDLLITPYLDEAPSVEELARAVAGLGCRPTDIIRSKEALFAELGLSLADQRSDEEWLTILSEHPKLIERPIVCIKGRYALGRPPENVKALLESSASR